MGRVGQQACPRTRSRSQDARTGVDSVAWQNLGVAKKDNGEVPPEAAQPIDDPGPPLDAYGGRELTDDEEFDEDCMTERLIAVRWSQLAGVRFASTSGRRAITEATSSSPTIPSPVATSVMNVRSDGMSAVGAPS
jgi:hypothetical protein